MYEFTELSIRPALADSPAELPLNILLALPEHVTKDKEHPIFPLFAALEKLLGQFGWEKATRIMKPEIWAPGWNDDELAAYVTNQTGFVTVPARQLRTLRADLFESPFSDVSGVWLYDIIHYVAGDRPGNPPLLPIGAFRRSLSSRETRLLILQTVMEHWDATATLGYELADEGGPAVLVTAADDPDAHNEYLTTLYANFVHNKPLPEAARPDDSVDPSVRVQLFCGEGGESLLQLHEWLESLRDRINQKKTDIVQRSNQIKELRRKMTEFLHRSQFEDLQQTTQSWEQSYDLLEVQIDTDTQQIFDNIDWAHEGGGVGPLTEAAEAVENFESKTEEVEAAESNLETIDKQVKVRAEQAPRVVNTEFVESTSGNKLKKQTGLVAGQEYDLCVDVGPHRDDHSNVATGNRREWPVRALPPTSDGGHVIQVVLISDVLSPGLVSREMWVPEKGGHSFPIVDGEVADECGAIALRFRTPAFSDSNNPAPFAAHGRLSLYFENNLVQSALVKVTIVETPGTEVEEENKVDVDYALSGSFQNVQSYASRSVQFSETDGEASHPIALSLTLNQDGANGHRIIVRGIGGEDDNNGAPADAGSPVGWAPYNPVAAGDVLRISRSKLLNCFFARDKRGRLTKTIALNDRNGIEKNQFLMDLKSLAETGCELFKMVATGIRSSGLEPADWRRAVNRTLERASVIQVARTARAEYVFPWALIYTWPLPGPKVIRCDVLEEWGADGIRQSATMPSSCPFENEPWHQENIICPYGFWGLKHILEQPLGELVRKNGAWEPRDVPSQISSGTQIEMAVAITRDKRLQTQSIQAHVNRLKAHQRLHFGPQSPADNLTAARQALQNPNLVYFLCHGEKVTAPNQMNDFYLGIGPRDNDPDHRIFDTTITGLADTAVTPNLQQWSTRRPLVFLNGCETCTLDPDQMLNFVSAFGYAKAGGVLGTEVAIRLPLAIEIAESMIDKISQGNPIGQSMYEVRWNLANKGNLLGLAYSVYSLADLQLASQMAPVGAVSAAYVD